ncbi:ABC transporter permease [Clostridium manihotivorum]|uniref:ABC-2 family transporter protein n=1 Tax=Clostridium manihotivorum TaxID=2320868 RepID=A0A410DN51_9CLOT|nr:ABC transporter permease [Clostridium manihotivorum]QAA30498.1 hypothetical protein C1I91_01785 [Clostridium manihotivorum]
MYDAVYCEFLKLKKSYFYLVIFLITLFFPGTLCLGWLGQGSHVYWDKYIYQVEQMNFLFMNLAMYAIIASYIFSREFSYNTSNTLFSYPLSRVKVFVSKFIVIILIITATIILQLALTLLTGLLLPHDALTIDIIINHLKLNGCILIFEIAILPIAIFISLLTKNVIGPVIYSGLATLINMFLVSFADKSMSEKIPFIYPLNILTSAVKEVGKGELGRLVVDASSIQLPYTVMIISALTFVIGMTLSIVYYVKADIN